MHAFLENNSSWEQVLRKPPKIIPPLPWNTTVKLSHKTLRVKGTNIANIEQRRMCFSFVLAALQDTIQV